MRHAKPYRKLSRQRNHYTALMRNLALAIFQYERIKTTQKKAKEVRGFIDKIITLGKEGTLHARRQAFSLLGNIKIEGKEGKKIDILKKVFDDISKRGMQRKGGHTRIIPIGTRPGDAAPLVYLELTDLKKKTEKKKKAAPVKEEEAEEASAKK